MATKIPEIDPIYEGKKKHIFMTAICVNLLNTSLCVTVKLFRPVSNKSEEFQVFSWCHNGSHIGWHGYKYD